METTLRNGFVELLKAIEVSGAQVATLAADAQRHSDLSIN
jgi:hypothetical protein